MLFNNVMIVASEQRQETIKISDFDFKNCTALFLTEYNTCFPNHIQHNLKKWVRDLSRCKAIVTVGDWSDFQELKKLVEIARMLEVEVVAEPNWNKYVEQNNN